MSELAGGGRKRGVDAVTAFSYSYSLILILFLFLVRVVLYSGIRFVGEVLPKHPFAQAVIKLIRRSPAPSPAGDCCRRPLRRALCRHAQHRRAQRRRAQQQHQLAACRFHVGCF